MSQNYKYTNRYKKPIYRVISVAIFSRQFGCRAIRVEQRTQLVFSGKAVCFASCCTSEALARAWGWQGSEFRLATWRRPGWDVCTRLEMAVCEICAAGCGWMHSKKKCTSGCRSLLSSTRKERTKKDALTRSIGSRVSDALRLSACSSKRRIWRSLQSWLFSLLLSLASTTSGNFFPFSHG